MDRQDIIQALERFAERTGYRVSDVRAALIDMDGTLYDSMPWHARAWHRMVTELGIDATVDEFFGYEGMTGKATINLLFRRAFGRDASDAEAAELYERKTRLFRDNNYATVMPGAQQMVRTFCRFGVTPVLVTGSGQASLIDKLVDEFDGNFDAAHRVTSRDVVTGKPSPEPYLKGLEIAGVAPSQAIVVENAPLGVRSGVVAGIFTIAVKTGPLERQLLADAGADVIFDSMPECARHLPLLLETAGSDY